MTDEVGEVTVLEKPMADALTPQAPENTEAQRKHTLYDNYRKNGGIFGKDVFGTLTSLTQEELEERQARESTTLQAKSLARIANITLTPRERKWYEYLRESSPKEQIDPESDRVDPARIADQKVLAEVFRAEGDMGKFKKYTDSLPEVFGKPKE